MGKLSRKALKKSRLGKRKIFFVKGKAKVFVEKRVKPPRLILPKRASKDWFRNRRRITVVFVVFSMYEEHFFSRNFENVYVRKVSITLNTSYLALSRLMEKLMVAVE